MKKVIPSLMTALALGTSAMAGILINSPAKAQTMQQPMQSSMQQDQARVTQVLDSGSLGLYTHFIDLAVGNNPLNELRITLPADVRSVDNIEIRDGSGQLLDFQTSRNDRDLTISFNPGQVSSTNLQILMENVNLATPVLNTGGIVQYQIDALSQDYTQSIPLGFARVNVQRQSSGSQS